MVGASGLGLEPTLLELYRSYTRSTEQSSSLKLINFELGDFGNQYIVARSSKTTERVNKHARANQPEIALYLPSLLSRPSTIIDTQLAEKNKIKIAFNLFF